jgi:acyl-CoA reductase-like NAD-dependent aldehyde dehydrogenase
MHLFFPDVFFTGSVSVGRIVYEAAAKHLTPVTLELGGKNPCIVDSTIDLALAAKRIAWAKFFNCGQTCITVDYILVVGEARRNELVRHLKTWITSFYGWNPRLSDSYGNIVSVDHAKRLEGLFNMGNVVHGGIAIPEERYVAPTLITNPRLDTPLMQDEVFGPIIPIIVVKSVDEAVEFVNARPHALALYAFSADEETQSRILRDTRSGAALVNECLLHPSNHHLPFGGVGASGLGNYHGERSFKTFTHERAVIHQTTQWWLDVPLRYPPYSNWMTKVADFITAGGIDKLAARLKWIAIVLFVVLVYIKRSNLKRSARQYALRVVMALMSRN